MTTEESNWEERHPIAARFLDDAHAYLDGHEDDQTDYLLDRLAGHLEFVASAPEGWEALAESSANSTADDYRELVAWVADINELMRTPKKRRPVVMKRQSKRQEERMERSLVRLQERLDQQKVERDQKNQQVRELES